MIRASGNLSNLVDLKYGLDEPDFGSIPAADTAAKRIITKFRVRGKPAPDFSCWVHRWLTPAGL
jgi:hypothetical protein